ncbi:LPXTG cell wall anchor domain-containing protein [Weissella muntiaci]|uniref:LPXTG cell wall anchor domain-containing protein n=1 Tax=Weissella muntiaci TaxID=2508881 RepID=A0A6C2CCA3_9LACO|nr:MucBP domain-containing protein [Weissella muntiaci]TYC51043.1 LPXTG cell wall anchor domain-containing protein [Weissella muntiaci]
MKKALLFATTLLSSLTIGLSVSAVHVNADVQAASQSSASSDDPQQMGTVTYQFIDMDSGEKIRDDETLTGKVGDTWSYDPRKHVHDYQMPNAVAFDGAFTVKPQVIKAFFTPAKDGSLNVYYKYSDQSGKEIKTTDSTTYGMWENFQADINKFELNDWELDLDKSMYSVDFGGGVRIAASLRQLMGMNTLAATVNQIHASPGYGNDGIIGFNLVFTRVKSNVTVNYVDSDGNKIAENTQLSGMIGSQYSLSQKAIEGYTLKSVDGDTSGEYGTEAQSVTYSYVKNEPISTTEDNSGSQIINGSKPNDSQNLAKATTNMTNIGQPKTNTSRSFTTWNSSQLPQGQQSDELPITGMNNMAWLTLLGILSVLTGSLFFFKKPRQF